MSSDSLAGPHELSEDKSIQMQRANVESGAYFWMDILRFAAASLVVFEHARDIFFLTSPEVGGMSLPWQGFYLLSGFGREAVVIFFVLSGFWITGSVTRRAGQAGFWTSYLIDRLSRLLLVVVPVLAIGALCDAVGLKVLDSIYLTGQSGALTLREPVAPRLSIETALCNLFFLQGVAGPTFGSNGPLWSLAFEFWYYIWFPALYLLIRFRRFSLALLTLAIGYMTPGMALAFPVWLTGSALFMFDRYATDRGWRRLGPGATFALGSVALGATAATFLASRLGVAVIGDQIAVGGAFGAFILVLLRGTAPVVPWARPMARYGAGASFSLYAIHFPLIVLIAGLIAPGGRVRPSLGGLAIFAGTVVFAWVIAWVFARQTEARTSALRKALRQTILGTASGRRKPARLADADGN